jgi:uncharacterized Zn-finger protein
MEVNHGSKSMKKHLLSILISTTIVLLFAVSAARAQSENELELRLSRDFGYSSGAGKIQGSFSMKVTGPENLSRVVFFIDEQSIGEDSEAPFRLQFSTDNYPLGLHSMSAVGYIADGGELRSNVIRAQFVPAEEGWQAGLKIAGPLLAIVFGAMILGFAIPILTGRENKNLPLGAPRKYGAAGGAICPKCGRPFALHLFGFNLGFSKFDRCPYCGKWSTVRAKPLPELRAAEAAELETANAAAPSLLSEEERLRRELESSRYENL